MEIVGREWYPTPSPGKPIPGRRVDGFVCPNPLTSVGWPTDLASQQRGGQAASAGETYKLHLQPLFDAASAELVLAGGGEGLLQDPEPDGAQEFLIHLHKE
jgi:hypothetical protein